MNDVAAWSLPLGRWFGIAVRVHLTLLLFSVVEVARIAMEAPPFVGTALVIQLMLFVSILLHEFGHCFAARHVDGDADEILMWPLGGLAMCQTPNTPWAHFFTAIGGPAVNVVLFAGCAAGLAALGCFPPVSPLWHPYADGLHSWANAKSVLAGDLSMPALLLARLFWVNWILFWFNILVAAYPMDGGRILQAILWPRYGLHSSMRTAVYVGYGFAIAMAGVAFVFHKHLQETSIMLLGLAAFIAYNCWRQQLQLEAGGLGDDSLFGYDFSQGYTSLERAAPAARAPRKSFWKRWLEQREALRREREAEADRADQLRLDELLAKIAAHGEAALSGEESRFLKRMSAKFRSKGKQ